MNIKAILLDIEGTVGPISYVKNVLFPYSTERMLDYLRKNPLDNTLTSDILKSNQEDWLSKKFAKIENPSDPRELNAYLQYLIVEDRKFAPLKWIQGKIWKEGYELGDLRGEVFEDVPKFFYDSKKNGLGIFIFSSGSIEAQQYYFKYTTNGNLGNFIDGYFDTSIGSKLTKESYRIISNEICIDPSHLVFFTDIVGEANASREAGYLKSYIMDRPGNKLQEEHDFAILNDFTSFF